LNCPPPIADILLSILQYGLVRIRLRGWQNDADYCAREADHLHNLPELLMDFSPERLLYYWEFERTTYANQMDPEGVGHYGPLWERLRNLLPSLTSNAQIPGEPLTSAASPPPQG
jgi:hypothetical protein